MASCMNCKSPVPSEQVVVAMRGNEQILVGPCCLQSPAQKVNYHFEVSSARGVLATVEFGGLTLQFRKSPEEVARAYRDLTGQEMEAPAVH